MNKSEEVKAFVEEQHKASIASGKKPGVDATTVAEALGIWRNDASMYHNTLVRKGILKREGTRPILFSMNSLDNQKKKNTNTE